MVAWTKGLIDKAGDLAAGTWIGTGANTLASVLVDPDAGNFDAAGSGALVDKGLVLDDVADDFCGRRRRTPPQDLGAIEYDVPGCDVRDRLARLIEASR
jgi:hypothetical protein